MMKKDLRNFYLFIAFFSAAVLSFGFISGDKSGNKKPQALHRPSASLESGKQGDAYRLKINNINLPLNRKGVLADVNIFPEGSAGKYNNKVFLFSSGFFLSGYANGELFANAVASASLVEDYIQGTVAAGQSDPRAQIYVLNANDDPFSQSWQDWKDAVALGADFYDGDGDGIYNPVDKNGNAQWDPDEDHPDLLGDETVWTVFNDGVPAAQRRWNTVSPLGIEVRQSVFGFASSGPLGNIVFVRYRFKYVGKGNPSEPETLEDVYFGVWADSDIGGSSSSSADDLVGSDILRNAGYTYNDGDDEDWLSNPPCFMIDFFSGPAEYIPGVTFTDNDNNGEYNGGTDIPLDTAFSFLGERKGISVKPGARNLPISSFIQYRNGDPELNDPDNREEARNYMLGLNRIGEAVDPCSFSYGNQNYPGCDTVNSRIWFSGDPVTRTGWINTVAADARQMTNTGPFRLRKGEEKEITLAYVVGQGADALESITVAREIDDGAQIVFNNNFLAPSPPPVPDVAIEAGEDFITLSWDTEEQLNYIARTDAWDLRFHGYNVWAFRTNNPDDFVNNQPNATLLAAYTVDNFIDDIYIENKNTGGTEFLYPKAPEANLLDTNIYSDPETGRIRITLSNDPFEENRPLIKGKPYYFAVTGYAINYDALRIRGDSTDNPTHDYYLTSAAFATNTENLRLPQMQTIVFGENIYDPPIANEGAEHTGGSDGDVSYLVVNKDALTGDQYSVTFFKDEAEEGIYNPYWKLTNATRGEVLIDSSKVYNFDLNNYAGRTVEGFVTKVKPVVPELALDSISYEGTVWYDVFDTTRATGIYYVGTDVDGGRAIRLEASNTAAARSDAISADRLRRIELRFGENSKAYRYLNGFIGNIFNRDDLFVYAPAVTAADTGGIKGGVGRFGQGYVDVPFSAWVVDEKFQEERKLAAGFIEVSSTLPGTRGIPDGAWDPTDSLLLTREVIIIFDADYHETGDQVEYTGGNFGNTTVWADVVHGFDIPQDAPGITLQQRETAASPWFNALYVIGLQKQHPGTSYSPGEKLIIPVGTYPYSSADDFRFTTVRGGDITVEDKKALFDKVNVFPNPLYGFNVATSYTNSSPDDPFVTFSNLPTDVTIKIFSLSGIHLRTLTTADKSSPDSPFLNWNLQNESGLRVASGLYIAIVSSPLYGEKILKFSIIMPQKQIPRF